MKPTYQISSWHTNTSLQQSSPEKSQVLLNWFGVRPWQEHQQENLSFEAPEIRTRKIMKLPSGEREGWMGHRISRLAVPGADETAKARRQRQQNWRKRSVGDERGLGQLESQLEPNAISAAIQMLRPTNNMHLFLYDVDPLPCICIEISSFYCRNHGWAGCAHDFSKKDRQKKIYVSFQKKYICVATKAEELHHTFVEKRPHTTTLLRKKSYLEKNQTRAPEILQMSPTLLGKWCSRP